MENIPQESTERLNEIKVKLDKFSKKLLGKFDKYVLSISLLPPAKPQDGQPEVDPNQINLLILVDDSDSMKLSKAELKNKLQKVTSKMAAEVDKNLAPQIIIVSELWLSCYDAKYDLIRLLAMSAPVHDKGMLSAIKISEIHKEMVLKKFEKYIVSYVLSGSLIRGEATATSDIDVFIVIDDTDVKKMTRAELKDKLRAIIIGMGIEAGEMTGVRNKLNIQVYILTDFWDSLKEANPIIFTLLRDGVPFFDRGIFMPWKHLLKMGKIKPSPEAIDMFMSSGEQMLQRVKLKLREIGMEDVYYSILTPSQAALMLHGTPPPAPRETAKLMREIFVKKEKMLEEEYVRILETNINIRKDLEHGTLKEISGKDVDKLMKDSEKYLKRIQTLFKQIERIKEQDSVVTIFENTMTILRDILRFEGIQDVTDDNIVNTFEKQVIEQGKVPEKYRRVVKAVMKAKKDYDNKKITKAEIETARRDSKRLTRYCVEYMERKRGRDLEKVKIRVKHGDKFGEVMILGDDVYIIHDLDNESTTLSKGVLNKSGKITKITQGTIEELEKKLANMKMPKKTFLKQHIFEDLKKIFGQDVEILLY
ncbi:nucleotidyltransferase domain-containing protein [Candidatus Woesearchaeota archaeon]|nr:nucleotidyltransferase domain-containing protein [Candidatus Woesearchaeota archaeon]